jgi:hypothetical protein
MISTKLSPILAFYRGSGTDSRGRSLVEILQQDDSWLEHTHDFIQWLFPLPEPSGAVPDAPLATPQVVVAFRSEESLRQRLRASFLRMLAFYGLAWEEGAVIPGGNWPIRREQWFTRGGHNDLRVTRILRSLSLLGLPGEACAMLRCLEGLVQTEARCGVSPRTLGYWRRAVAG